MSRDALRLAGVAATLVATSAFAYPQYIVRGEAQCSSCHYSPTGGGFETSMGQSTVEGLIPDLIPVAPLSSFRAAIAKPELTGYGDEDQAKFQVDVGLDTRILFLQTEEEVGEREVIPIPMLLETGAVAAYGPALAYATVTVRKRSTDDYRYTAMSREHWLSFAVGDSNQLRAGRVVLPFGLRMPDHTLYTREDFGFNKYQQSYGLSWDFNGDENELHVAAFAGDLWLDPPAMQERGGAVSYSHAFLDNKLSVGASALFGISENTTRPAASVFVRANPFGKAYVLAEAAGQRKQNRATDQAQAEGAGFLRVGWFPHDSTDLFVELAGRVIEGGDELTKLRYQFGIDAHLLPWVELSPSYILEEDVETGLKGTAMVQLHVFY